jgi:transcriptional regulator with XRE-family HTH domain
MEIKDVFGRNLRMIRRAKGLSQEELAHRAGIDRTYVSALERSVYSATIDVVDRLARELDVEVAALLQRPSSSGEASGSIMDGASADAEDPARKDRTGS